MQPTGGNLLEFVELHRQQETGFAFELLGTLLERRLKFIRIRYGQRLGSHQALPSGPFVLSSPVSANANRMGLPEAASEVY